MTDRWTAPETGWYRMPAGHEPEYLGTEQPEPADHEGTWTVIHFEAGTVTMNSGKLPPASEPSITITWNG